MYYVSIQREKVFWGVIAMRYDHPGGEVVSRTELCGLRASYVPFAKTPMLKRPVFALALRSGLMTFYRRTVSFVPTK